MGISEVYAVLALESFFPHRSSGGAEIAGCPLSVWNGRNAECSLDNSSERRFRFTDEMKCAPSLYESDSLLRYPRLSQAVLDVGYS